MNSSRILKSRGKSQLMKWSVLDCGEYWNWKTSVKSQNEEISQSAGFEACEVKKWVRENEEEKSQGGKKSGKQKGEERFSCTTLVALDSSIPKMEDYKKAKTFVAIDSKASDELENHFCPNTMDPSFLEDKQSLAFLETSLTMIILRWFFAKPCHA